jgi:EAL domain-containing protein (putative c-di-GMP-specific phosphodiesterase class I)
MLVADRLLAALDEPHRLAGHEVHATASIGVIANLQSYASPGDALRDADTAMYEAKSAGKGRYVLFDQAMHATAKQRLRLEQELRGALANREFFLEYQPIVSLESRRTAGFEALLRWNHPLRGRIMPADFIAVAEETGLIVQIGTWAIEQACQECATWRRSLDGKVPYHVNVNLSRRQLTPDLVETVRASLENCQLPPECLHLEVTETAIMKNLAVAKATLSALRGLRVKIDMDDFGTGYSSLAYLRELPIDILKIDRSFIENMVHSQSSAAMVHAVANLSQSLGLEAVAEGIETAEQLAMLRTIGCRFGQGFLFSKPLPADKVVEYLTRPASLGVAQAASLDSDLLLESILLECMCP